MLDSGFWSAVATGIFSVVVALGSIWVKHFLDSSANMRKKEEEESVTHQDVESMMEIQEFLDGVIEDHGFDRGSIHQFHNGGKFFNGVAMKKYSLTFESTAPGIAKVKHTNQNIFVTEHPSLMKNLNENDIFYVESDNPALDYIRDRIEEQGILQIISIPMRSLNGSMLGFIQFFTIKKSIEFTPEMSSELIAASQRISGYLHS